jgi:Domain of unknown function (DUF397)
VERMNWRKSARSGTNGENCVEVADLRASMAVRDSKNPNGPIHEGVAVRDSKDPHGPVLTFSRRAFCAFAADVKGR